MSKNPVDKLSGFCLITGASSGIGLELAKIAARDNCDLLLVADRDLAHVASALRDASLGTGSIDILECDLATESGIDAVLEKCADRQVDVLMANAGQGEGGEFLDQDWMAIKRTIDTNITGTVSLIHKIGGTMRAADAGRILVTGSIVDDIPGPFNLVYNSTKAFVDDFCAGLSNELKDSDVVVSCCPITPKSHRVVSADAIGRMKSDSYFINISRGKVVDEEALIHALQSGRIAGAGLDVTYEEPLPEDSPLWDLPNVILTSHSAGASDQGLPRSVDLFVDNLNRYVKGETLRNVVDKEKGY